MGARAAALVALAMLGCGRPSDLGEGGEALELVARASEALERGELAPAATFAVSVTDAFGHLCSGALLLSNLVVTARHCVATTRAWDDACAARFGETFLPAAVAVTTDGGVEAARWRPVARVVVGQDDVQCGNDVALLVLEESVDGAESSYVAPALDGHPPTDAELVAYGGVSSRGHGEGIRRRRAVELGCGPSHGRPCPSWAGTVTEGEGLVGPGVCPGDSGGALVATTAEGLRLFGVVSRGFDDGSEHCGPAVFVAMESVRGLLARGARVAVARTGEALPNWARDTPAHPETSSAHEHDGDALEAGDACGANEDCAPGLGCAAHSNTRATCLARCTEDTSCASSSRCRSRGLGRYCVAELAAPRSAAACVAGGPPSPPPCGSWLVAALLVVARVRQALTRSRRSAGGEASS